MYCCLLLHIYPSDCFRAAGSHIAISVGTLRNQPNTFVLLLIFIYLMNISIMINIPLLQLTADQSLWLSADNERDVHINIKKDTATVF